MDKKPAERDGSWLFRKLDFSTTRKRARSLEKISHGWNIRFGKEILYIPITIQVNFFSRIRVISKIRTIHTECLLQHRRGILDISKRRMERIPFRGTKEMHGQNKTTKSGIIRRSILWMKYWISSRVFELKSCFTSVKLQQKKMLSLENWEIINISYNLSLIF